MLLDTIRADVTASLKSHNTLRTDTLRFVLSAIKYRGIELYGASGEQKMSDEDVIGVLKKQAKTREESIEAYTNAHRFDLSKKEEDELAIIREYLPAEMSDEDLKTLVSPFVEQARANFGQAMSAAMKAAAGKVEGKRVSEMLKKLLSNHQ